MHVCTLFTSNVILITLKHTVLQICLVSKYFSTVFLPMSIGIFVTKDFKIFITDILFVIFKARAGYPWLRRENIFRQTQSTILCTKTLQSAFILSSENHVYYTIWASRALPSAAPLIKCKSGFS